MPDPNRCETCGWWDEFDSQPKGHCRNAIAMHYDPSEPSTDAADRQVLISPAGQTRRIGLYSIGAPRLITSPDFGCKLWKEKE